LGRRAPPVTVGWGRPTLLGGSATALPSPIRETASAADGAARAPYVRNTQLLAAS
jgi:hypothetical protein